MAIFCWATPHLRDAGVSRQMRRLIYLISAFVIGIAMAKLLVLLVLR